MKPAVGTTGEPAWPACDREVMAQPIGGTLTGSQAATLPDAPRDSCRAPLGQVRRDATLAKLVMLAAHKTAE
jgi:hypothetical protein